MAAVKEGTLSTGVPYLRLGEGPPLLVASGLTAEHANPTGAWRRMSLSWAAPFAEHFTVYLVNRRPGLAPGSTMSDIAADYAGAIEQDIGEPVALHGTSTGGSVALQLAVDRPELIQRMVLAAAACRLSPHGRKVMDEVAQLVRQGDKRRATSLIVRTGTPRRWAVVTRGMGWVMGGFTPDDQDDMLVTIAAEDSFDAEPDLRRVQAPTLVLGGADDEFYSRDLFERTAAGLPRGRAVVLPGKSHVYVAGSKVAAGIALGYLLGGDGRQPTVSTD
ncbi:MAG TPA: alpha/beta hydrolase [Nocardioides sp.]|uniref:alpha/beta fold hydrolase n=1 Tax=Nocardioides sp. TaxID=35761 RepID=UPI002D7E38EB|nr:alpha/beta hydrolase [Nocardioides sp.]HET6654433.1 alpha/beta hydrolase [Nocardioides sp.]